VKMEDDLSLDEMAQSVGLSAAHFGRMFRKSTGETPINLFCAKGLSALKRCCVLLMRDIGRGRGLWFQDPAALCAGLS